MASNSVSSQFLGLLGWLLVAFSAAAVGAMASVDAASFYAQLTRPSWAPPAWLFGPVWSALYALMGVAAWLVWRSPGAKGLALSLFSAQLFCVAARRVGRGGRPDSTCADRGHGSRLLAC